MIVAEAGAPHAAWNAGEERVHVLVDFRPALRTEVAFETLAGLARDGKTTKTGVPSNPLLAALDPAPLRARRSTSSDPRSPSSA